MMYNYKQQTLNQTPDPNLNPIVYSKNKKPNSNLNAG